jgi:N-acetylneuraminic acid mutarotase
MKKNSTAQSAFFNLRLLTAVLVCAAACLTATSTLRAFFRSDVPARISQRTLTFAERVMYQHAIEDVYWRHRIWPRERPDPKPSLDVVMSQAQLEKKVADYLRKSQALEDYWQRTITAEQLQAEMDRMALHTKQPEVLRELFEALGNDPFVIAECLVRPALAERLLTNWYAYDQRIHGELKRRTEAELQAHNTVEQMKQTSGKYSEVEYVKSDSSHQEGNLWLRHDVKLNSREWNETVQQLAANFAKASAVKAADFGVRRDLAAFQSADMSAHSKSTAGENYEILPVGRVSPLQEDTERYYAVTIISKTNDRLNLARVTWVKEPLELWLARAESQMPTVMAAPSGNYTFPKISEGACSDDTWSDMGNGLPARHSHTAVWSGSEMIIWGGWVGGTTATGARYNPSIDSWSATNPTNAPIDRDSHTAVWTGTEMIVWGGSHWNGSDFVPLNTGARYNPGTDSWVATSIVNAPDARAAQTAVWTGSEMIIWGGAAGAIYFSTGGRYNPTTDSWIPTSTANAPSVRGFHTAVWTGDEVIVWGGWNGNVALDTGGRYNPSTDSWTVTSVTDTPTGRDLHTAVWTGGEMIVWGGWDCSPGFCVNGTAFNTGGKYNPNTDSWTATSTINVPDARIDHAAIWTGSEIIVWGGLNITPPGIYLNTGGKYNPSTDSWTPTTTTNAPQGREFLTGVWTGSEMIVWGGYTWPDGSLNTGARYNPSTDSWTPTFSTPKQRWFHTSVWTGSEMIVWGGEDQFQGSISSGGRYNPDTDTWTDTSTTNAPDGRWLHTAVWTGSEMIIWGGNDESINLLNTGGRYDPSTNSWTATSTTNAPQARYEHTAVWTGSEMTIWGGFVDISGLTVNTGGKYNPSTDSWTATSTTHTPDARAGHRAVWTGSEMIVWGGCYLNGGWSCFNTGGRYDPNADSWTAMSTTNAPDARSGHAQMWTGAEMIVWGGHYPGGPILDTGGRYDPGTDSWTATTTTNAPDARFSHTGVWTGSQMIIWGGEDQNFLPLNTGGRYDPGMDSWTATSTTNALDARYSHTAVWTGSEMIVWGGTNNGGNTLFNTGGRYCAQSGPTPSPTPTPTPSPTATSSSTPRPTPTPRPRPTPRVRP